MNMSIVLYNFRCFIPFGVFTTITRENHLTDPVLELADAQKGTGTTTES